MSFGFHVSQAWQLFRRKKRASLAIIFVCAVASISATLAIAGFYANTSEVSSLSQNIVLTVFMESRADSIDVIIARERIQMLSEVDSVHAILPAQAKREFARKYGATIDTLLPNNPFPTTFRVRLREDFRTPQAIESAIAQCKRIPMVNDATYRSGYANAVDVRTRQSALLAIAVGSVLLLVFLVILFNVIRANTTFAKNEAEILALTGAKRSFIAAPHIIKGFLLVGIGAFLGAGTIVGLFFLGVESFPWLTNIPYDALAFGAGGTLASSLFIVLWTAFEKAKYKAAKA